MNRNQWGALHGVDEGARMILADALLTGTLAPEYVAVDRKHRGSALNYDIYDAAPDCLLIQERHTTCDKYGNHPQKNYLILIRVGDNIAKIPAPHKMAIARAAKLDPPVGHIIKKITGCTTTPGIIARYAAEKMGVQS